MGDDEGIYAGTVKKKDIERFPALEKLTAKEKRDMNRSLVPEYLSVLEEGKTPHLAVTKFEQIAKEAGAVKYREGMMLTDKIPGVYFIGPDGNEFAMVLDGDGNAIDGLSIIVSHGDSPCLTLDVNPIRKGVKGEGAILAARPYGGLWRHSYVDTDTEIIGRVQKGRKINYHKLEGIILERGIHITHQKVKDEKVDDAFSHDFKVETGYSKKDLLDKFKKEGIDPKVDFFTGSWFVVPTLKPRLLGNLNIIGWGHDDLSCGYAALKAALNSKNRKYPAVFYLCDREEIGSTSSGSAQGIFFDIVTDNLLKMNGWHKENISDAFKREMFSKSRSISADVDVALTQCDKDRQDERVAAKLGYGPALVKFNGGDFQYMGNRIPDYFSNELVHMFKKGKIVIQLSEMPTKPHAGGGGTIAKFLSQTPRGIPAADMGVATANMHGKVTEINKGDLYQAYKSYKLFFERD